MPLTQTWDGGREMEVAGREETNPLFFAIPAIIPLPGQGALHTRVHPLELRFPNRRKRNQITQTTSNDTHAQTKSFTDRIKRHRPDQTHLGQGAGERSGLT